MKEEVRKAIGDIPHSKNIVPVHLLLANLQDKFDNKVTQDELDVFCFEWSYYYALDDLKYVPLPAAPPQILDFFKKATKAKIKIMADFSQREPILTRKSLLTATLATLGNSLLGTVCACGRAAPSGRIRLRPRSE